MLCEWCRQETNTNHDHDHQSQCIATLRKELARREPRGSPTWSGSYSASSLWRNT